MEIGLSDFQVWHQAGQGVPDPDVKRMGFFITTSDAQTLLEFDLSQVKKLLKTKPDLAASWLLGNGQWSRFTSLAPFRRPPNRLLTERETPAERLQLVLILGLAQRRNQLKVARSGLAIHTGGDRTCVKCND